MPKKVPVKPRVPPLTPKPTYGPRGVPYKSKSQRPSVPTLPWDTSSRSRLGRLLKFRKGGYTKKGG